MTGVQTCALPILIGFELHFNRQFRLDSSGPITRRDESDSKSRSEFEFKFEFDQKLVEFYRKLVEFEPKTWCSIKFDGFSIKSTFLGPNSNSNSNLNRDFESDSSRRVIGPLELNRKSRINVDSNPIKVDLTI